MRCGGRRFQGERTPGTVRGDMSLPTQLFLHFFYCFFRCLFGGVVALRGSFDSSRESTLLPLETEAPLVTALARF